MVPPGAAATARGRSSRFFLCVLALLAFACLPARAEYRLQPSDVLELAVAGLSDFNARSTVDLDGNVTFPMVGRVKAEGRMLGEVLADINRALGSKTLQKDSATGVRSVYVDPEQVTLSIATYSPIYVGGDVARPGNQPFRPGLNVRQAIAVAGGYDVARARDDNPFLEAASLRGELDKAWIAYADALVTSTRLRAEFDGGDIDAKRLAELKAPAGLVDHLIDRQQTELALNRENHSREIAYLKRAVVTADELVANLAKQLDGTRQDMEADTEDFGRVDKLFHQGLLTANRVTDSRQALLSSSMRHLATVMNHGEATQRAEKTRRDLTRTQDDRRSDLLAELTKAEVETASAEAALSAASEKLLFAAGVRAAFPGGPMAKAKITIFSRAERDGRPGAESDLLQPGDLIEVTLEPLAANGAAPGAPIPPSEPATASGR